MFKHTRRSVLALLAGSVAFAATADAQAALPSPAERAHIASRMYSAMQMYFAHWDDAADVDLDAAYRDYLDAALAAPDRLSFVLASQEFLARFRNGHTIFMDRAVMDEPGGRPLGFALRFVEGRWVVTASQIPELRVGDVVAAVDGQETERFYQDRRKHFAASTEQWARRVPFVHAPGFFSGGVVFPASFSLTLADGRTVRIDRAAAPVPPAAETTQGRWLVDGRVAYIRIPSFAQPSFEAAAMELLKGYSGAEALVVDVRGNNGGSSPVDFTAALMDRPYRWWAESTPMTLAIYRHYAEQGNGWYNGFRRPQMMWPATTTAPRDEHFRGKVVLLVDGGCNSACEDFVMPFKDNGRATLVGETTAGSTGQPHMMDFGNGMMAVIGAKREIFPNGSTFEGVGIRPDVEVAPRLADIRAGRDPVLERALRLAR
jgi:carboxyl-terminal processing protease